LKTSKTLTNNANDENDEEEKYNDDKDNDDDYEKKEKVNDEKNKKKSHEKSRTLQRSLPSTGLERRSGVLYVEALAYPTLRKRQLLLPRARDVRFVSYERH
jgi:hypothetical protein